MKKFVTLLAASSLAMTMAATTLAKENMTPGQACAGLTAMSKRNCMRGALVKKMENKMENKMTHMKRMYNKRQIKDSERDRQRMGGTVLKAKSTLTNGYYSSAASTSSSAGSAMSSSASSQ